VIILVSDAKSNLRLLINQIIKEKEKSSKYTHILTYIFPKQLSTSQNIACRNIDYTNKNKLRKKNDICIFDKSWHKVERK